MGHAARAESVTSIDGRYLPIENYGVIGDLRTTALIGVNGSIDWFCYPDIDSPSVFGRLLDAGKGGYFQIQPVSDDMSWRQQYWPDTNVLVTRFFSEQGMVELIDFMPLGTDPTDPISDEHCIIRHVQVLRGCVELRLDCVPAFDYARAGHTVSIQDRGATFHGTGSAGGQLFRLGSSVPLREGDGGVSATFTLSEGERAAFSFAGIDSDDAMTSIAWLDPDDSETAFQRTVDWWRHWLSTGEYRGRWREEVNRSVLTLKLLDRKSVV